MGGVGKRIGVGRGEWTTSWPLDLECGSVTVSMVSYPAGRRLVAVSGINVKLRSAYCVDSLPGEVSMRFADIVSKLGYFN